MASTSNPETGECRAYDKDNDVECDCTEYTESSEQPGYCGDCFHKRKTHLIKTPGASLPSQNIKSLLASVLQGGSSKKSKGKMSLSGVASSSRKLLPSSLRAANRESNHGMRPPKDESTGKKGKEKSSSSSSTKSSNGGHIFKVGSLIVINKGTEWIIDEDSGKAELRIIDNKTPGRVEVQKAMKTGLGALNFKEGFSFDRRWMYDDIVEALTQYLPYAFPFFASLEAEAVDGEPAWCLATAVQKRLEIAPLLHPTGEDVEYNKGNTTTGFRNSKVFIVARNPIPPGVLTEWTAQISLDSGNQEFMKPKADSDDVLDEAGTDSESDSPNLPDGSPSPERIPRHNKLRLFSKMGSDDDEDILSIVVGESAARTWRRGPVAASTTAASSKAGTSSDVIDLTADNAGNTVTPKAPLNKAVEKSRASSEESEVYEDPVIGNPYDKNQIFEF
ncbi:hypothetical protein C8R43DRAFT_1141813 [Mycena crocata]|nr:hypothetical protein C8R43DRAFT_1141813 [Mycena crocata]